MTLRSLAGILALVVTAQLFAAEPVPFLLKGKVAIDDAYVFSLKPNNPTGRPQWLALGEVIDGYTLLSFDHPTNTLTLKKGDATLQVAMDAAAIGENVTLTPAERQQRDKERMLRMKPALEAGQPIKGSVVIMVDGKAVAQPVEFVMGRETRIEAGGQTTWLITPKLNDDGTVSYNLQVNSLEPAGPGHAETRHTVSMRIIDKPWGQFSMMLGQDRSFGFVPEAPKD